MRRNLLAVSSLAAALLMLTACGQKTGLTPPPGKALPVAPYGRSDSPSFDALLAVPAQAQPERNVELRRRSETRADDPFDLPPAE